MGLSRNFKIYYLFNSTEIDKGNPENAGQLDSLLHTLRQAARIDSIVIYSYSSPEGSYRHNAMLANERGSALRDLILSNDSLRVFPGQILLKPTAENWQGLADLVHGRYDRHDRSKVLQILADDSIGDETRKWRLKQLDGGYTWDYMYRHYMPLLRTSTVICIWTAEIPQEHETPVKEESAATPQPEPVSIPEPPVETVPAPSPQPSRTTVFALRSNLLVPLMNIGAEVPLGNNWSVGADYYFPWIWPPKTNKNCFELLGWSVEGRYWFGRSRSNSDRLKGHSLGLYGAGGYYDFERNYKGQQGEFASAGIDYTYAIPAGRKKRVNFEFTLAMGYIHAWGRNYSVHGNGGPLFKEDGDVRFDYVGPTKAAISLVIPLYQKGGRK